MKRVRNAGVLAGAVGLGAAVLLLVVVAAGALMRSPAAVSAAPGTVEQPAADAQLPSPSEPIEVTGQAAGDPADAPTRAPEQRSAPASAAGSLSPQVLAMAAERAPFDPERRAPEGRYLFPEERVVERPRQEPEPPPAPPFRVVGAIAGTGGGGVAVIEPEGQSPKVLAVGDEILGYRISSIEGNVVVVSSRGWDVSLAVEALAPTRVGSNTGRGRDRDDERRGREQERALEQVRERIQEAAQRLQQLGGGGVRMEQQGDRIVITGENGARQEIRLPQRVGGGVQIRGVNVRPAPAGRGRGGGGG